MKKSIVKRISLSSVLVVIVSLAIFSSFTIILYKNTMEKNFNEQLIIENRIAYNLLLVDKFDEPAVYKFLTESQNLVFKKLEGEEAFTLTHGTLEGIEGIKIERILRDYIEAGKKVVKYEINGNRYLMTISTNRLVDRKADSIIVSLLSTEDMYELMKQFIWMMLLIAFILSLLSVVIFRIIARRISEPILKVIEVTKEYEKRNFEPEYIVSTQDEIQDLSVAVNKMAHNLQKYDLEKEKLFRTISHEIKTPLTAIYGYAEGMKKGIFSDQEKPLNVIMDESMRIKSLTENYILLSKLESKIETFEFKPCQLAKILERAIHTIESIAIVNDIDIDYIPVYTVDISGDEEKLYRAFLNILTNEIKYTNNTIKIVIEDLEDQLVIRIEDNGSGFTQEALDNYELGLTSEKTNGSGVGLFITQAIIKKHKGTFDFSNKEDQGAMFIMTLPKTSDMSSSV